MKITHYCNSFISIKSKRSILVCDPWIGKADNNAWLSYPIHKNGIKILNNLNPDYIYISHLHNDHFDPKILKKFKYKKTVKIIIKKYNNERLKNKIKELNFKNIIEITPWEKFKLNNDFFISIIPQETNNTAGLDTKIKYDLDTSIVVQSSETKQIFYNNVDNPLSINNIKKLNNFVKNFYKSKINITCFALGGASEYPQCFININRAKERKNVIDSSIENVKKKLDILKPEIFFPAGGNYVVYGKFNKLNKFIAQPDNYFIIFKKLKKKNRQNYEIEGGNSISFQNNIWVKEGKQSYKKSDLIKKINKKYSKDFYGYEKMNVNLIKLDSLFLSAEKKYTAFFNKNYDGFNWKIVFHIFNNLKIDKDSNIKKQCKQIKQYTIKPKSKIKQIQTLDCFLDKNLFYGLLTKKINWNIALSGSLIMFKRKPNKFIPDVPFSLNFLNY